MKTALILSLPLLLAACASTDGVKPAATPASEPATSVNAAKPGRGQQVGDVMSSPLNDLNLANTPIPPILQEARLHPYLPPSEQSCEALAALVRELDAVLAPDLDAEAVPGSGAAGMVENAGMSALRRTIEGFVPFRGILRTLSGADRYADTVAASIVAGNIRRAYLKGLGQAKACAQPAAPRQAPRPP
ncbi:MAG: hypothetical protein V4582_14380 [Pseudomonadota bacterium]